MTQPLLQFINIEKAFFGVKVLQRVSFVVPEGGAIALVGENGAGKSTLMNILGGNLLPDQGMMKFAGREYSPHNPQDASRAGIAFIHQELNLFPNLSIAENLFLTGFPRAGPFIHHRQAHNQAAKWLQEAGLDVPPALLVEKLSPGERQLVEIAKALSSDARLVIFDEPTTSLSAREIKRLFTIIATLRSRGIALIYISHALDEVFQLCDDIVVLRDGAVAGSGPVSTFTRDRLVSLMIGREVTQIFPERSKPPSTAPLLEVQNLSSRSLIQEVSFTLRRGEVLGLGGLMGAGRTELARAIFGLDPHAKGTLRLDGQLLQHWSPASLIKLGVAFLTENRQTEGLCLDAPVSDNLVLPSLREMSRAPVRWLKLNALHDAVRRIWKTVALDEKVRERQPVRTLSGGNQQKVVLGKWLLRQPLVLILDEPTRGIDVGAKFEIYQLIRQAAENGSGVLLIASELEELIGLCDRILVMKHGSLVEEFARPRFDRAQILAAALGESKRSASA